jgi:hypothetical protein
MKATTRETKWWRSLFAAAAVLVILVLVPPAQADTVSWTGTSGDWSNPSNWSPDLPDHDDDVKILNDTGEGWEINYNNPVGEYMVFKSFTMDATGTGSSAVTLRQTNEAEAFDLLSLTETIGDAGSGTFAQSSNINNVSYDLYLGYQAGSRGTYDLSGTGILAVVGSEWVGKAGTGVFIQSGGKHRVTGTLTVASESGSSGTYDLSGGSLSTGNEVIGALGIKGTFTQSGGTHKVNEILYLGAYNFGSRGTYNLSGNGSLTATSEIIGYYGQGVFTQSGGTNTVTHTLTLGANGGCGTYNLEGGSHTVDTLMLGEQPGSRGTYNLSGTGILEAHSERVGNSGTGILIQSGGTHTVTNSLFLGRLSGSSGTYNLEGGSLSASDEFIGYAGTGTFTQSSGTNTVTGIVSYNPGFLLGGAYAGSSGTYNLEGGSLSAPIEHIGYYVGAGVFTQRGGTNTVDQDLILVESPDASGTYNLSGSGSLSASNEYIGYWGTGFFIQSGGTNAVTSTLTLGNEDTSNGTYILSGSGSLSANEELIGSEGMGVFIQTDGTHTVKNNLRLGYHAGIIGIYNLSGTGILEAGYEWVGNSGTGILIQSGGTHTVTGTLTVAAESGSRGTYDLSGGSLSTGNEVIGALGIDGTFTQSSGTNTVNETLYLGAYHSGSRGTYILSGSGNLAAADEVIGYYGTGFFTQSGGTNTVTDTLTLAAYGGGGTYNLEGGTLSAGTIQVNPGGAFNVTGVGPTLTTAVTGNVVNAGTVKTTNANVTWVGTFINNGVYTSDPSTQTFAGNLEVGSSGYLVAASTDTFIVQGDFKNQSTQNTDWDTGQATLQFVAMNGDTTHDLYINGEDQGVDWAGYEDNFAWDTLDITDQTIYLFDGRGDDDGGALYIGLLLGLVLDEENDIVLNIFGQDTCELSLYYDPGKTGLDGTYAFAGGLGSLIPTPLPPAVLLLGSGLLGLGLLGWRRRS